MYRFCHFLTLVTDEVVSLTGIKVFVEDDKYPAWYLYQAANERETHEKETPVFLFQLAHLLDQFESMLKKWFSVGETMVDAIHLMMDAQRIMATRPKADSCCWPTPSKSSVAPPRRPST